MSVNQFVPDPLHAARNQTVGTSFSTQ